MGTLNLKKSLIECGLNDGDDGSRKLLDCRTLSLDRLDKFFELPVLFFQASLRLFELSPTLLEGIEDSEHVLDAHIDAIMPGKLAEHSAWFSPVQMPSQKDRELFGKLVGHVRFVAKTPVAR